MRFRESVPPYGAQCRLASPCSKSNPTRQQGSLEIQRGIVAFRSNTAVVRRWLLVRLVTSVSPVQLRADRVADLEQLAKHARRFVRSEN